MGEESQAGTFPLLHPEASELRHNFKVSPILSGKQKMPGGTVENYSNNT